MTCALKVLTILAFVLLAVETSAIRVFDQRHPLKREVGKVMRTRDGKFRRKEVEAEHLGRAVFDPSYANEEDLTHEDLGLDDLHDPTEPVIQGRLRELFPTIDANHDGGISSEELQRHLFLNGIAVSRRRADAEFADTDANHDGKVTPAEYLSSVLDDGNEEMRRKRSEVEAGVLPHPIDYTSYVDATRAAMYYADADRDGGLNKDEFWDFLNPEEGNNAELRLNRLRQDLYEQLVEHGSAKPPPPDSLRLTFDQFYDSFWSQFTVWETQGGAEEWSEEREKQNARRKFVLLDTNSDNLLSPEELLPVFADLHPTESRYARMQAEHMMDMAECKDDHLTLEQMLQVPHAFYGVVHDEDQHEEL